MLAIFTLELDKIIKGGVQESPVLDYPMMVDAPEIDPSTLQEPTLGSNQNSNFDMDLFDQQALEE